MLNDYASCFLSHVGFNSLQESLMAGQDRPRGLFQSANSWISRTVRSPIFQKKNVDLTSNKLGNLSVRQCD